MSYVYILQSLKNNRYYIGSTNNLDRRLSEHLTGKSKYTKSILPIKLVFKQEFLNLNTARGVEFWLKKQKSRELISKIISAGVINKFS